MEQAEKEVLKALNARCKNTLMETLDIEFTALGADFVEAKMPVTPKVHQPDGVLHGGASVALAETVGSVASHLFSGGEDYFVRGIEISANHVKSIRQGTVYARGEFLHKGRTTQLWAIKIRDEQNNLISAVKLTTIALPKSKK